MSRKEFEKQEMESWLDADKKKMIEGKTFLPSGGLWSFQEFMEDIAGIGYREDFFDNAEEEDIKDKIADL